MNEIPLNEFAQSIRSLHDFAGLSWSQIGRLMNSSERTARWWATGHAKTVNVVLRRSEAILAEVVGLGLETPLERRSAILRSGTDGQTMFQKWKKDSPFPEGQVLQLSSYRIFRD